MVEQQRQRIEQEMTKMINELDMRYLRKMQVKPTNSNIFIGNVANKADMHRCAAKCCDNQETSLERVQKCVETCSVSINNAQNYVQKELEGLQNKLQRCVMDCNDDVRVQVGPNPTETEVDKFTKIFEVCATKCVDTQIGFIPALLKRMKSELSKS